MVRLFSVVDPAAADHWATGLIDEFGTLGATVAATASARQRVTGDPRPAVLLDAVRDTVVQILEVRAGAAPIVSSLGAVVDYLVALQGHSRTETFRTLFLDTRNRLLKDEMVWHGSPDRAGLSSRAIMKRALELDAASIILAHNHPGGDPTPSAQDIALTRKLQAMARNFSVVLHDHIIVATGGWCSLRERALLD